MKWRSLNFVLFLMLCAYASAIQSVDREMLQTYTRLSAAFHEKSTDAVMSYIDQDFQSDMGWNKKIFRYVINQLFSTYPDMELVSQSLQISVSSTHTKVMAHWKGHWFGKMRPSGDRRIVFPAFGTRFIRPESDWYQTHEWTRVGRVWKLTRAYMDIRGFPPLAHTQLKPLVNAFHEHNGQLGLDYGRNILNSVDTNGVLFIAGEAPAAAIIYLKEYLHERPDVTIYDNGYWFGDVPGLENIKKISIEFRPRVREQAELNLIRKSGRSVFSMMEKQYFKFDEKTGRSVLAYRSIPWGLVYKIVSVGDTTQPPKSLLSGMTNLDADLKSPSTYTQREMVANYHFNLGRFYTVLGEKTTAMNEFLKAGKIGYDIEGINYNVGNVLSGFYHEPTTAIQSYSREVQYNPWFSMVYFGLGTLQKKYGMTKQAIDTYERGLLFNSEDANALLVLAQLYTKEKNWEFAKDNYIKFMKLAPYNQKSYLELAKIYEILGQKEHALETWNSYLKFPAFTQDSTRAEIEKKVKMVEKELKTK